MNKLVVKFDQYDKEYNQVETHAEEVVDGGLLLSVSSEYTISSFILLSPRF
ncbi:hypothetical protein KHA94_03790 [Bacillus sp. FJAT-49705]|uniref:Uncharacterized protein n=1 Tax=Cytobacillus citreus TaxID=2833586 RepID=A0ABS5NPF6_9BACI|nr:hypothetical protein [Cytobacillus citreus]MBS4189344.1 hypothetical protein [Cytobacillus citreus]